VTELSQSDVNQQSLWDEARHSVQITTCLYVSKLTHRFCIYFILSSMYSTLCSSTVFLTALFTDIHQTRTSKQADTARTCCHSHVGIDKVSSQVTHSHLGNLDFTFTSKQTQRMGLYLQCDPCSSPWMVRSVVVPVVVMSIISSSELSDTVRICCPFWSWGGRK